MTKNSSFSPPIRIGNGYDIHRFGRDRKLFLCGCEIPHSHGLIGHSDADAPIHALIDALLGALALGDIGQMFPDTDPAYLDVSGKSLLLGCLEHREFRAWQIGNVDITIITQLPRLAPHIPAMREKLADILQIPVNCVSVKAKTNEKLDAVGKGDALVTHASVILFRRNESR